MKKIKYIVGIDEVGRGPIAGPVAVSAFLILAEESEKLVAMFKEETGLPIRDSKKLTKKQRQKWFDYFKKAKVDGACDFAVSLVSNEMIDKFGIVSSIKKALNNSLEKITEDKDINQVSVYLDGGLKAEEKYLNQETLIKGDELIPIISLASIVAKVSRDKIMEDYAGKYKNYGFEKNVGYGTRAHYEAIKKYGITKIHRKSFLSQGLAL
jgi:ribonuclease HII